MAIRCPSAEYHPRLSPLQGMNFQLASNFLDINCSVTDFLVHYGSQDPFPGIDTKDLLGHMCVHMSFALGGTTWISIMAALVQPPTSGTSDTTTMTQLPAQAAATQL